MKIYTKTGDAGQTGLFGGPRVRKDDPRIVAYGTVDELNAALGLVAGENLPDDLAEIVARVQHELFALGAQLATPDPAAHDTSYVGGDHIAALEREIDGLEGGLAPLKQFILPGGSAGAAGLHMARTICRRAERCVVHLAAQPDQDVAPELPVYLKRLSDLLFVMARAANAAQGVPDVPWQKPDASQS